MKKTLKRDIRRREGYIIVKNELGEEIGRISNNNYEITYETKTRHYNIRNKVNQ